MSSFTIASTVLALCLYVPLCFQLLTGKVTQNIATWVLWSLLDAIILGTLFVQHGNCALPAAYTAGGVITTICIIRSRTFRWTRFESFVSILVIICISVWMMAGSEIATVASTMAMAIAGIPQIADGWQKPKNIPILVYAGYLIANCLAVAGGKEWTIQDRFYATAGSIYCLAVVLVGLRVFNKKPTVTRSAC